MPWCEECQKYWTPSAMNADGTCPRCGDQVEEPRVPHGDGVLEDERAPWHFKLMMVALVAYLVWRFVAIFT